MPASPDRFAKGVPSGHAVGGPGSGTIEGMPLSEVLRETTALDALRLSVLERTAGSGSATFRCAATVAGMEADCLEGMATPEAGIAGEIALVLASTVWARSRAWC